MVLPFLFKNKKSQEPVSPAKELLKKLDTALIVSTISEVEDKTTAELRIHLEDTTHNQDPYTRAKYWFEKLGMTKTTERNGVLLYIAVADRKLAILGDKGIYEKVSTDYWVKIKEQLVQNFTKEQYTEGMIGAIKNIGEVLIKYFPNHSGQKRDELSNEISVG
jgi:uncharacterized membrane protein YgcG